MSSSQQPSIFLLIQLLHLIFFKVSYIFSLGTKGDGHNLTNGFNYSPTATLNTTGTTTTSAGNNSGAGVSMSTTSSHVTKASYTGTPASLGTLPTGHLSASTSNLNCASLQNLGSQVVAYHVCQADNNITCMVPDFVHSLAAYLSRAPQLQAYRDLLTQVMEHV